MFTVNVINTTGFSAETLDKVTKAKEAIGKVFNSDIFKDAVLNFQFDGEETFYYRRTIFGNLIDHAYTNQEVFDILMKGNESPGNSSASSMDLYLVLLQEVNPNVVGYGNPGSKEIYTYRNWFETFTVAEYAGHITHEWTHKLGFSHSFHHNRKRKYSVPYAIGDLIEAFIEKDE
jgi:hypothetical protein